MYCIQCGVELADTEKICPLCMTRVYHPEIHQPEVIPMYPAGREMVTARHSKAKAIFLTVVVAMGLLFSVLCDLQLSGRVSWSGYAVGGLLTAYVLLVLPCWFQNPNPVIFVPCGFAAILTYLMYINLVTAGSWFLSFAFPVTGGVGLLITAFVTLLRYIPKGKLYIVGGTLISLGGFTLLTEFLLTVTFPRVEFVGWSVYPLTALALLGGFLIFLGICPPARESMKRKFFF